VYRDYVDLSVAVATPKGLVTPVVRNAEGMNFIDIEKEIASLGKKARDGKLTLEDMAGGSFTMFVSLRTRNLHFADTSFQLQRRCLRFTLRYPDHQPAAGCGPWYVAGTGMTSAVR
jgi:hypothetical protein